MLGVIRVYQAPPSLQTTIPGPTARAAGIVTLVRGAACADGGTEKDFRGARLAGLVMESESFGYFKAHRKRIPC